LPIKYAENITLAVSIRLKVTLEFVIKKTIAIMPYFSRNDFTRNRK